MMALSSPRPVELTGCAAHNEDLPASRRNMPLHRGCGTSADVGAALLSGAMLAVDPCPLRDLLVLMQSQTLQPKAGNQAGC